MEMVVAISLFLSIYLYFLFLLPKFFLSSFFLSLPIYTCIKTIWMGIYKRKKEIKHAFAQASGLEKKKKSFFLRVSHFFPKILN